jgi:hypothetical protein
MQEAVTEYIHTHVNSTVFECSIRVPVTSRAGDDRRRLAGRGLNKVKSDVDL